MRKKSKKEKHIGEGKTFATKSIGLVPNISYNNFFIWDDITKYMHLPHELIHSRENENEYDDYYFPEEKVNLLVNEENKIETILCTEECYWAGINLIKLPYEHFLAMVNYRKPNEEDLLYVLVSSNRGQNQKVYTFDEFGLMLWAWRGKIVTVYINDFREK